MTVVLVMAATLWGIGAAMRVPAQARWTMIGLLLVAVLTIQVVLPAGHVLREATGGSPQLWLLILGAVGLVAGYRAVFRRVAARARAVEAARQDSETPPASGFSEVELNRYARHIVLREVGGAGQRALKDASVLVIGAGGLGSPALLYLAAAGVGRIGVIDDDTVSGDNLQRQVLFRDAQIGAPKVQAAFDALTALNPFITIRPYNRRLTEEIAADLLDDYDLILDGCDNWATRVLANRAAVAAGKPLVSGAVSQWEGQVAVFDPASGAPCHACIFPAEPAPGLAPSCAEAGIIGALPGIIGSMMAAETIKLITGAGEPLRGRMMIHDALHAEARVIAISRSKDCPVCGATARP